MGNDCDKRVEHFIVTRESWSPQLVSQYNNNPVHPGFYEHVIYYLALKKPLVCAGGFLLVLMFSESD